MVFAADVGPVVSLAALLWPLLGRPKKRQPSAADPEVSAPVEKAFRPECLFTLDQRNHGHATAYGVQLNRKSEYHRLLS